MRRRDAAFGLAAAASALPSTWAQPSSPPWSDAPLRGFTTDNMHNLTSATLTALRATGARLARVGLVFPRREDGGWRAPSELARRIDELLEHSQKLGLGWVVVGAFEGADDRGFWRSEQQQQSFVGAWEWFARRFANAPALRGLDLMNEPHPALPDGLRAAQQAWGSLASAAARAIRATGSRTPIVFEPVAGANVLGLQDMQPLADRNTVYSIHFYTPHDITHQGVSASWTRRIPYPAGVQWQLGAWNRELGISAIDGARLDAELEPARAFARRHRTPIYVGEFGCVRWAPDGSALRWVRDCLAVFERERWSWSFHSFRTWPGWDPEIDSESVEARSRRGDAPLMRLLTSAFTA